MEVNRRTHYLTLTTYRLRNLIFFVHFLSLTFFFQKLNKSRHLYFQKQNFDNLYTFFIIAVPYRLIFQLVSFIYAEGSSARTGRQCCQIGQFLLLNMTRFYDVQLPAFVTMYFRTLLLQVMRFSGSQFTFDLSDSSVQFILHFCIFSFAWLCLLLFVSNH